MPLKNSRRKIDAIMAAATASAMRIVAKEALSLMRAKPERYARFVMPSGWGGPVLFDNAGKSIRERALCPLGKAFMAFANSVHADYGGDNSVTLGPTYGETLQFD